MPARIPLDVDLEDKLLYGLTPMRLAYLLVGLVVAFASWTSHWSPLPVRGAVAVVFVIVAGVAAWGRWRTRALDDWVVDCIVFAVANHRVQWRLDPMRRAKRRAQPNRERVPGTLASSVDREALPEAA